MKKFLFHIFILVLPYLIIFALPIYCLCVVGELKSFDLYIQPLQKNQLWGLAYNYYDREYKFFMTEYLKPDIVELGTSRSMQVDENIFNKKYFFYNAGGAVQNSEDYLEFIKSLDYNPTLIIIDVNQFFFNPYSEKAEKAVFNKPQLNCRMVINSCIKFYQDLGKGKIKLDKLGCNNNIGLLARMENDGFTRSGTYFNGRLLRNRRVSQDYNFKDTMSRIKSHNRRFQTCNYVDLDAIGHFDSFLKECKKRGIMVIGFLPPFAHMINEVMRNDGDYRYLQQIYEKLLPCFNGKTHYLFDYTDVMSIGGEDINFLDGFHAGVVVDNLIFKDIISRNKLLSKFFVTPEQIDSINMEYINIHPRFHDLPLYKNHQSTKFH